MRSLPEAAGIRVGYECAVEKRIEFSVQCVMYEPVAYARLVDIARFRVADFEMVIAAVAIGTCRKFVMQGEDVLHQVSPKFLHIRALVLSSYEFPPRFKQILDRNDILVGKTP